jgi:hypothetical protein
MSSNCSFIFFKVSSNWPSVDDKTCATFFESLSAKDVGEDDLLREGRRLSNFGSVMSSYASDGQGCCWIVTGRCSWMKTDRFRTFGIESGRIHARRNESKVRAHNRRWVRGKEQNGVLSGSVKFNVCDNVSGKECTGVIIHTGVESMSSIRSNDWVGAKKACNNKWNRNIVETEKYYLPREFLTFNKPQE